MKGKQLRHTAYACRDLVWEESKNNFSGVDCIDVTVPEDISWQEVFDGRYPA